MNAPRVSVVVPVFRNRETVGPLHARVAATLDAYGAPFEVIFVDDGCPEGSLAALRALSCADARVRVLAHERNRGQQWAVLSGLARARGEVVVVLDADLQDPPEAIPALLDAVGAGWGAAFAGRRGSYESAGRLFTSRAFKRVLSIVLGTPPDAGLFVALRRDVAERVCRMAPRRPHVVALVGASGAPMTSMPVKRQSRLFGSSSYGGVGRLGLAIDSLAFALAHRAGLGVLFGRTPPAELESLAREGSAR